MAQDTGFISESLEKAVMVDDQESALTTKSLHEKSQHDQSEPVTPRRRNSGQYTLTEVEAGLQQRGLKWLRRAIADNENNFGIEPVDMEAEQEEARKLFEDCATKGFRWHKSTVFQANDASTPSSRQHSHAFMYGLRDNGKYPDAKLINVNFAKKTVEYIADQRIIKERDLLGAKVAADLVSKHKLMIWYKGDKTPIDHSLYDERYRDHFVDVLRLRDSPLVDFACVQKGIIMKRGKTGLTHNPRFVQLVHGNLIIYHSQEAYYPVDSLYLPGMEVKPKSSASISITSQERQFVFKFKDRTDRDKWLDAIQLAINRFEREQSAINRHNKIIKARYVAKKQAQAARKSSSKSSLRGYRDDDDDKSSISGESVFSDRDFELEEMMRARVTDNNTNSNSNGNGAFGSSHSLPSLQNAASPREKQLKSVTLSVSGSKSSLASTTSSVADDQKIVAIPEEPTQPRSARGQTRTARVNSLKNPRAKEYEVRIASENSKEQTPIGFIMDEGGTTLEDFRAKIMDELDYVPTDFVFLSQSNSPVHRKQEASRCIGDIAVNDAVCLKAAK